MITRKSMTNSRHIYIYQDVEDNLKNVENVSQLVNELLRNHFKTKSIKSLSKEELERTLKIKKIELEALKKMEEVENGTT